MEINTYMMIRVAISMAVILAISVVWKVVHSLWLRPKKLEKHLRQLGFTGNPYRLMIGDYIDLMKLTKQAYTQTISLSDNDVPRIIPQIHKTVQNYGNNSFVWFGSTPRLNIMDPEMIREVLAKTEVFRKQRHKVAGKYLEIGLAMLEGRKWAKHRRIINPAFHMDKLKNLLPTAIHSSCSNLLNEWKDIVVSDDKGVEVDVWPFLGNLSADVISRAAFGSSYEEGRKICSLLAEQLGIFFQAIALNSLGCRFLPTRTNRRIEAIYKEINAILKSLINRRKEKLLTDGFSDDSDLLGILLESNLKEMEENSGVEGMSMQDVIGECKLFYLAGHDTATSLMSWTMVLLSKHQIWQTRARDEVLQVLGKREPNFEDLNNLKVVNMILHEVLRLYPPPGIINRSISEEISLKGLQLLPGMELCLPQVLVHRDKSIWGEDADEFNPERFSNGVSGATNIPSSFFPFGGGPRVCIGQNFVMIEAKMALARILQHFAFNLSPDYVHSPILVVTIIPQHGAKLILRKL